MAIYESVSHLLVLKVNATYRTVGAVMTPTRRIRHQLRG